MRFPGQFVIKQDSSQATISLTLVYLQRRNYFLKKYFSFFRHFSGPKNIQKIKKYLQIFNRKLQHFCSNFEWFKFFFLLFTQLFLISRNFVLVHAKLEIYLDDLPSKTKFFGGYKKYSKFSLKMSYIGKIFFIFILFSISDVRKNIEMYFHLWR